MSVDLTSTEKSSKWLGLIQQEMLRAEEKNGPFNSAHEAWAVLFEEVDELWDEVKLKHSLRDKERMAAEAVQIAASALRFIIDICEE